MKLVEIGKESGAGHGPGIASPASTQQGRKSSAGVVGCARADEVDCRRSCAAADSRASQRIVELDFSRRANTVVSWPRYQAAARSRAAYAPGRGRLARAPADPAACATGFPLPYPPPTDTVVYYNASQLKRFRKKKKYGSQVNAGTPAESVRAGANGIVKSGAPRIP